MGRFLLPSVTVCLKLKGLKGGLAPVVPPIRGSFHSDCHSLFFFFLILLKDMIMYIVGERQLLMGTVFFSSEGQI